MNARIDNQSLKTMGSNITYVLIRQLVGIFVNLALAIFLARMLGAHGNGVYTLSILLPAMLSTFLNLGISPANVYFIASNKISIHTAFKASLLLWALLSLSGILIVYFSFYYVKEYLVLGVPNNFLLMGLFGFPLALLHGLLCSLFQGAQDFKNQNIAILTPPIMTLIFALISVGVFGFGVEGAITAFVIGQLMGVVVILAMLYVKYRNDKKTSWGQSEKYVFQCLNYGWKAHLSNILAFINYKADLFLVNFLISPTATGIYVVAIQVAERLWVFSRAVSTVILPRLAELCNDEKERCSLTPLIARWVFILSFIIAMFIAVLAPIIVVFFFGNEYQQAGRVILLLLPGILFGSMSRVLANDIAARGKPEINLYTSIPIVMINISLNIILIPQYGIEGAAVATTISYLINTLIKTIAYSYLSNSSLRVVFIWTSLDQQIVNRGLIMARNTLMK